MDQTLLGVFNQFKVDGEATDIVPFGNGLINKTFLVKTDVKDYMLQIVNSYVFKNVDALMRNIYIVTSHLRGLGKTTLHVRKTMGHKIYVTDKDGVYYRLYTFIKGTKCYEKLDSLEMVYKTGAAFGDFHSDLSDLDSILIAETIPDFHNTPKRYDNLLDAVKQDEKGRVPDCLNELNFIMKNKKNFSLIMDGLEDGTIPQRIVHNDPKINNVLFDAETGDVKCVIDLDTVMPGSYLFDYGDALRSLFTGDNESSRDSSLLKVNRDVFKAYTEGYLSKVGSSLTEKEISLLPMSVFTIAIELGIRFLEDYLRGDKYFKTSFEGENLVRAKNQLALAEDVYNHMDELTEIVNNCLK